MNEMEEDPMIDQDNFADPMLIDLPASLIITNVAIKIFNDEIEKDEFENLFKKFETEATFQYFKSFRRVRVNYSSSEAAAAARIQVHQATICGERVNCYFAQPTTPKDNDNDGHLHPPALEKQFLISPPASPPVGWEPIGEHEPCIDYDLLAALANLAPGESHELHPPSENKPGIYVHICEETGATLPEEQPKVKIQQTKCPERANPV